MGLFDTLLDQVAETDREVFKKYPKIAEEVDRADEYVNKWQQWKAESWDDEHGTVRGVHEQLAAKDNEIEALKLLQGNDMTWDEMKGNVETLLSTKKVVTAESFERDILPKVKFAKPEQIDELSKKLDTGFRGMDIAYAASAHLPTKYLREFGFEAPEFTMADLFKHMGDKSINNFEQAYESFVAPLRQKKSEEQAKVRDEQIKKEAREEVMKEFTLRQGALPVDNEGSAPEMSALKMKIESRRKVEGADQPKLSPGELGSGAAAGDAYQQYLKDAAAGAKPKLPGYLNIN